MPAKKKKKTTAKKKTLKKRVLKRKAIKRKPIKKRTVRRKPAAKKKPLLKKKTAKVAKVQGDVVGTITHYFPKVRAAVIKLKAELKLGDMLRIKGHTTDLKQLVNSLQIDRVPVDIAKKGQEIGLLVDSRVRQHDTVYKI